MSKLLADNGSCYRHSRHSCPSASSWEPPQSCSAQCWIPCHSSDVSTRAHSSTHDASSSHLLSWILQRLSLPLLFRIRVQEKKKRKNTLQNFANFQNQPIYWLIHTFGKRLPVSCEKWSKLVVEDSRTRKWQCLCLALWLQILLHPDTSLKDIVVNRALWKWRLEAFRARFSKRSQHLCGREERGRSKGEESLLKSSRIVYTVGVLEDRCESSILVDFRGFQ